MQSLGKTLDVSHDVDAHEFKFRRIIRSFLSSGAAMLPGSASDSDLVSRLVRNSSHKM